MTQETNRIIVDTNKHGIRREINLDSLWKKAQKKKNYKKKDRFKPSNRDTF